jgi:Rrf2 family iron-sulfur cluster assembly transcriptional regulator
MCLTHDLWSDLSGEIDGFLTSISLADLVGKKEVQGVATRQDEQLIHARHL